MKFSINKLLFFNSLDVVKNFGGKKNRIFSQIYFEVFPQEKNLLFKTNNGQNLKCFQIFNIFLEKDFLENFSFLLDFSEILKILNFFSEKDSEEFLIFSFSDNILKITSNTYLDRVIEIEYGLGQAWNTVQFQTDYEEENFLSLEDTEVKDFENKLNLLLSLVENLKVKDTIRLKHMVLMDLERGFFDSVDQNQSMVSVKLPKFSKVRDDPYMGILKADFMKILRFIKSAKKVKFSKARDGLLIVENEFGKLFVYGVDLLNVKGFNQFQRFIKNSDFTSENFTFHFNVTELSKIFQQFSKLEGEAIKKNEIKFSEVSINVENGKFSKARINLHVGKIRLESDLKLQPKTENFSYEKINFFISVASLSKAMTKIKHIMKDTGILALNDNGLILYSVGNPGYFIFCFYGQNLHNVT